MFSKPATSHDFLVLSSRLQFSTRTHPYLRCGSAMPRARPCAKSLDACESRALSRHSESPGRQLYRRINNRRERGIRHDDMLQAFMEAEYKDGGFERSW